MPKCFDNFDLINGSINESIARMVAFESRLESEGYKEVELKVDGDYDAQVELIVHAMRLETEKEALRRIKKVEKAREKKTAKRERTETKEMKEFERLRKKYEKEGV